MQVTINAAEEELINMRKECVELRKTSEDLQISDKMAELELIV